MIRLGGGLTSTGNQLWHQDSAGIADTAEAGDSFGGALAAGDLNGDGATTSRSACPERRSAAIPSPEPST